MAGYWQDLAVHHLLDLFELDLFEPLDEMTHHHRRDLDEPCVGVVQRLTDRPWPPI